MSSTKTMSKAAILSFVRGAAAAGLAELIGGIRHWRVWHLLGVRDLRHRYARSKLGQFWLVMSTAIMIGALAAVWSLLWKQPLRELMPFFGIGLIMWTFITQVLTDCTSVFVTHGNLYRNQKMNFSMSIYAVIYKNTLVLAHSFIIVVFLICVFDVPINWYQLQIVPAFILTWITMLWLGHVIAMICVRFRDFIQVIVTWLSVFFFLTPVFWKPGFLPSQYHFIIDCNPLAQFLELLRNPLLGAPVSSYTWLVTVVISIGGGLLVLPVIGHYQRRVIFWV
jgi:lipopolysaccharide transport system permease protein